MKYLGIHDATGFVGSRRRKAAQVPGSAFIQFQANFFRQLPPQRSKRVVSFFDLAPGLHETWRPDLSDEEEASSIVVDRRCCYSNAAV
ncbi:hypothetical protein [Sphingomonas cavernae]|uniref:hypothetical protein n=1 Tax=Sphingomonas cavernae TaxID=2320861 RepID=UPI0016040886|nr:hypothetical protein [Sphingomonas cavernae]